MEISNICLCCLRRPADRDMKMPYKYFGRTEIYSDMLKECFEIHLTKLLSDDERRICEACVGCLRDAYNFKLQVLQSQAELQRLLAEEQIVKEEECSLKSELSENDEELIDTEIQTSDVCNEPMIEYEFKQVSYPKPKKHTSGIRNKPNTCIKCGQHFKKKTLLARHKRTHNACAKPYSCESCQKSFRNKHHLDNHRYTHTGERPHCCEVCGKLFSKRVNLKTHQLTHVKGNYSCELCTKSYSTKEGLRQHLRTHEKKKVKSKKISHKVKKIKSKVQKNPD